MVMVTMKTIILTKVAALMTMILPRVTNDNNNNDFISIALFHAKHAQLR